MADDKERPQSLGASPPRNFTLTTAERVGALVTGPPPHALRLRRIEDLERTLVRALRAYEARTGSLLDPRTGAIPAPIARQLARMNELIDAHNRYYPIEKQLPMNPRTRQLMDGGEPWAPTPPVAVEALLARVREVRGASSD